MDVLIDYLKEKSNEANRLKEREINLAHERAVMEMKLKEKELELRALELEFKMKENKKNA